MHFRSSVERHRRWRSVGVVGLAVVALGLSACSPGVSGSAGAGAPSGKLTTVTMTNTAKGNTVKGALSADGLTWTSGEPLGYGSTYSVVADAVNADGTKIEQTSSVSTLSPAAQAYPAMIPA